MPTSTIARGVGSPTREPMNANDHDARQSFDLVRQTSLALDDDVAVRSVNNLNQLLADTLALRDLYRKHHWQASGASFYVLHLLFDKHFEEQSKLSDLLGERVQMIGGVSIATAQDVSDITLIPRAPKDCENPGAQIARLLHAHEVILLERHAHGRTSILASRRALAVHQGLSPIPVGTGANYEFHNRQ